ncbi:MAG: alpha/beta hydrolase [Clostridiaceae bacterium]|jgi:acetyl esterase/lipase|nr:alpha/beta hydrolase [Clostridiaceae bacterium]
MSKYSTWFVKKLFDIVDVVYRPMQNPKKRLNADGIIVEKDICYDASLPEECCLNVYYKPKEDGAKYPVFIYIHGGGFVAGDKEFRTAHALWLANQGFFVVNVNYGFCPKYRLPQLIVQVVGALNTVYDATEKYNLDLDKVVISGDSAGAYFSSELIAISTNDGLAERLGAPELKIKFAGAVLNCGIYDLERALGKRVAFNLGEKLLDDLVGIKVDEMKDYPLRNELNPIYNVNEKFPPSFITSAGKDIFCGGQAESLQEKLAAQGSYFESFVSKKFADNHCFSLNWKSKAARENNELTEKFLKRFL